MIVDETPAVRFDALIYGIELSYLAGKKYARVRTNFDDEMLSFEWNESNLESDDLKNYRAKAEFCICGLQAEAAIAKLKSDVSLNAEAIKALEYMLWSEVDSPKGLRGRIWKKAAWRVCARNCWA